MAKALFDTNILIDHLRGIAPARTELGAIPTRRSASSPGWRCWLTLPDAIVWASAQVHGLLFVTRDAQGFPGDDPGIRMP